jgi:hypothetical protein
VDFTAVLDGLAVRKVRDSHSRPSSPIATGNCCIAVTGPLLVGGVRLCWNVQSVRECAGMNWAAFFGILYYLSFMTIFFFLQQLIRLSAVAVHIQRCVRQSVSAVAVHTQRCVRLSVSAVAVHIQRSVRHCNVAVGSRQVRRTERFVILISCFFCYPAAH